MKLPDFKLERFFAKYEFTAPYILCSSDPQSMSVKELLSLENNSQDDFMKLYLGYPESKGGEDLRKEISKLYKGAGVEDILCHSGGEEGIFLFMNNYLEKGDHVISLFPAYQSLYSVAESIGCEMTFWKLIENEDNSFNLDLDFLRKNIKKNTKAIIVNFPHNPTGYLPDLNTLNEFINLAKKNNVLIFSDEVYRHLVHDKTKTLPSVVDLYENSVSTGSMSKAFGLPGLRVGWTITKNQDLLSKMWSYKDFTTICSSSPGEFLATIAIKHKETILDKNLKIILENLKILSSFFEKYNNLFIFNPPSATAIAFPRIRMDKNVEDFCVDLAEKKGVFLLPSTKYDYGDKNFRVGFGKKNMKECLGKFEEYIINL